VKKTAHNRVDLSGKQFKDWTVESYSHTKTKQPFWNCACSCGTKKIVGSNSLRNGSMSCGCSKRKKENKDYTQEESHRTSQKHIYASYRAAALKRNYTFNLSFIQFIDYLYSDCFYCGASPSNYINKYGFTYWYTGVDRVDNTKGYSTNNCVPSCKQCNTLKMGVTPAMIYKLYHLLFNNDYLEEQSEILNGFE
jgi:hypothetical protein